MTQAKLETNREKLITQTLSGMGIKTNHLPGFSANIDSNPLAGVSPRNWCNQWSGYFNGYLKNVKDVNIQAAGEKKVAPGMIHPAFDGLNTDELAAETANIIGYALFKWNDRTSDMVTPDDLRLSENVQIVIDVIDQFTLQTLAEGAIAEKEAQKRNTSIEKADSMIEAIKWENKGIDVKLEDGTKIQVKNTDSKPSWDSDKEYDTLVWISDIQGKTVEYQEV